MTDYSKWQKFASELDEDNDADVELISPESNIASVSPPHPIGNVKEKKPMDEEKRKQAEVLSKLLQFQKENYADIKEPVETDEDAEKSEKAEVTDADVAEYFEIEEEERIKNENAPTASWDELMAKMDALEAKESGGGSNRSTVVKPVIKVSAKELGNAAFSKKQYQSAIDHYSAGIKNEEPLPEVLYCNRSLCYFKLERFEDALQDADVAVFKKNHWGKAHYRRGMALAALKDFKAALVAFESASAQGGSTKEVAEASRKVSEMKAVLEEQAKPTVIEPVVKKEEVEQTTAPPPPRPVSRFKARRMAAREQVQ